MFINYYGRNFQKIFIFFFYDMKRFKNTYFSLNYVGIQNKIRIISFLFLHFKLYLPIYIVCNTKFISCSDKFVYIRL